METIKYAIKKGNMYLTERAGYSKDIDKADLVDKNLAEYRIKIWPIKNAKPVPIRERYTREEV